MAFTLTLFGKGASTFEIAIIIASLIIGCLVTHTFLDIIPSVFLGAPDEETALSVLPGHRLMLKGRGYEAIKCSALGSFGAVLAALLALFPARLLMGTPVNAYEKLWPFIPFILVIIVSLLVLNERGEVPDLSRRKKHKLGKLKVSLERIENACSEQAMDITPIALIPDHRNETINVRGKITRIANNRNMFLGDGEEEILVTGRSINRHEVGQEIIATGKVEGRVTWNAHLLQKCAAASLFLFAGLLGLIILGAPGLTTHNWYPIPALNISPSTALLFPLFTGLFGLSTLSLSLMDTPTIPEQQIEGTSINLSWWRKTRGILSGTFAGGLVGWYPGVTSAQATVLAKSLAGGDTADDTQRHDPEEMSSQKEFIVAYSGVNTANGIFNVIALYVILRARSGAMHAVQDIMQESIVPWEPSQIVPVGMALMLVSVLIAAVVALFLTLYFGRVFARIANKFPYKKMVLTVMIFLIVMIFFLSGPVGMAIAAVATCVGLIPPLVGLSRVHLMGVLMLPIMLFFLGLDTMILRFMGLI